MTSSASNLRVLIVNTLYAPYRFGGAERSVQLLAESLHEQAIEAAVYTLCPPTEAASDENINGVAIHRRPLRNIYWPYSHGPRPAAWRRGLWHLIDAYNPAARKDFREVLKRYRPDIIHWNNLAGFSTILLAEARARCIPSVLTLRDYYYFHPDCRTTMPEPNLLKRSVQGAWRSKNRRAYMELDALVGISNWILGQHATEELDAVSEQAVIYNPVENPDGTQEVPASVEYPSSGPLVLGYIGRLEPAKGTTWLLETLAAYPGIDDIRLLVAGDGEPGYLDKLKSLGENLQIRFLGHVEPPDFYRQIDLLLVPSLWDEPFGRVLAEAAEFGVAAVVSNRGALPELVQTLGAGYVYSPDDSDNFYRVLEQAIQATRTQEGRNFQLEPFSPAVIAGQYRRLYQSVISKA